jgi:outer membrane lipoprotein-sorting protein
MSLCTPYPLKGEEAPGLWRKYLHSAIKSAYIGAMRQSVLLSLLAGLALAQTPPSVAAPAQPRVSTIASRFSAADLAQLKRVSTYLNTMKNVQGRFLQLSARGASEQGTFYLKKPGRVRFEYQQPNTNLVIADGSTVAVENNALKTTDRYPLANSPLRLLLSDNIDLANDSRISLVKMEPGALSVTAREDSGPAQGSITLTFADAGTGGLELRQWEVLDAQGARTAVIVSEMRQVTDIPARLFVIQDLSPFKKTDN